MALPGNFILAACTEQPAFFSKLFEPATMAAVVVAMTAVIVMILGVLNFITYRAVAHRQLKMDEDNANRQLKIEADRLKTEKKKLNLDLFEKRLGVWYEMIIITDLVQTHRSGEKIIDRELLVERGFKLYAAYFLFKNELHDLLTDFLLAVAKVCDSNDYAKYDEWVSQKKDRVHVIFKEKMDYSEI